MHLFRRNTRDELEQQQHDHHRLTPFPGYLSIFPIPQDPQDQGSHHDRLSDDTLPDHRLVSRSTPRPRLGARFWGVRGTHPAALPTGTRFGGNTTCLEIRYGRHIIIIDAGSGIIALGDELSREMRDWPTTSERPTVSLLFTHAHHDHLCGMPFFAPIYQPETRLHLLGPDLAGMRFEEIVAGYMRSPYFPVDFRELPSERRLTSIGDGTRLVWMAEANGPVVWDEAVTPPPDSLVVDVLHSRLHPREGTLVYRISAGGQTMVFATDIEIVEIEEQGGEAEQRYLRFIHGVDVLVHDAQYSEDDYAGVETAPTRGFGHSTPVMAARVARKASVGRLILFHHDPGYADADIFALEQAARQVFPATVAAREGGEIFLDAPLARQI
jgi:phosphoribosyl 1,2-cyclic phosphodiesterase